MKHVQELIQKHCSENEIDIHQGLNALLDYLIEFFDFKYYLENWEEHILKMKEKSEPLFEVCTIWLNTVTKEMDKGKSIDFFGELYESMYQSKGKSSTLGQFFTPTSLCDLMSKLTSNKEDGKKEVISDPACGSGRTLISYYMHSDYHNAYYIGEDIDIISVKMCALNMMIHGMRGRVIRHDTLREPVHFDYGFEINEVRYPFPTPYYSLRRISNPKK